MSFDLLKEFGAPEEAKIRDLTGGKHSFDNAVEDDFGDFEDPISEQRDRFADTALNISHDQQNKNGSQREDHEWKTSGIEKVLFDAEAELQPAKSSIHTKAVRKVEVAPSIEFDDQFDAWEPQEVVEQKRKTQALKPQPRLQENPELSNIHAPSIKSAVTGSPPTNIPPPSILLSLSARLLHSLPSKLKESPYESEQSRIPTLQHHLSDLRTIAHILAGRKLRWKRDGLLSQSMKIGPAGKQGGMKLTGVDKTEGWREDQEAAEVLRMWKQQAGLIRSAVGTLKGSSSAGGLSVPELAESMPVRQAKPEEGAVTAPKACFLCGVKRDERVSRADVGVEDSFGEWWVEHWGHVDCVGFWTEQNVRLAQR